MSSFVKASGNIVPNSADPGEEFPFLHTITVVDRVVSVDKPELVQNNIKTETVTLNLDSEWDGLSTVINIGNEKPVSVIWSGEPVVIPAELMRTVGSLDVSVVGYGDDGGIRAVTKQAQSIFNVVASGFVEGDEAVPDPTTVLGQLIQAADNANQAADRFNQASEDIEGIGPAIEKVHTSEANAKHSETNAAASAESASQSASTASASAEAARTSETNAAASASTASEASTAAKVSETNAASSATAASQSASQAQSSATAADSSARAASTSANSAKTASDSATSSKDAAAQSASEASASASAAKASETNAASSASAAKTSETNAAASATAAQNAVDGFGLEVGTTTTGEPGTDAAVEIQKTGTKYTANFTIPRGEAGPSGVNENVPLGSTSGVVAQAKDAYPTLPRKVQVHGRTIENLWPNFNESTSVAGITISQDDSGFITLHGTSTSDSEQYVYRRLAFDSGNKKFFIISTRDTDNKFKIQLATDSASSYSEISPTTQGVTYNPVGDATVFGCYIRWTVPIGETVNDRFRVMLVEGDTNPGVFTPSGVHTVEPTKLVTAGKNLLSYPAADNSQFDGALTFKNEANGPVKVHVDMATNWNGYWYYDFNIPIPAGTYTISYGDNMIDGLQMGAMFSDGSQFQIGVWDKVSKKTTTFIEPKTITQLYFQLRNDGKMGDFTLYPMIELGSIKSDWEACETVGTDLPSGISLADGDTLAIDRDGTTQIVHAEGEPTVLENVTLPEIPTPTFNVYTTGGYVPPTVDVDYEQDVNLVLQALKAKIASLEVNQAIM